jgi:hypothetical protein
VHIDALLSGIPAPVDIDAATVRASLDPRGVLVVLDDDPTGTQSVANLPVLTRWEKSDLAEAFATGAPAVYVLTNTRSLDEQTAAERNREVVAVALAAASEGRLDAARALPSGDRRALCGDCGPRRRRPAVDTAGPRVP